jgi:uncharacterized protein
MKTQLSAGTQKARIEAVDALRGFALFGILIAHVVEQYLASLPPSPDFGIFSRADAIASGGMDLLVRGKFFMMFSLLFGLSFFLQLDRAADRDSAFRSRFVRRLIVLFAIGLVHHLFYRGDILTIYALLGLVLVLFHRASDRTLLVTALVLFLGLPRLLLLAGASIFGFNPLLMSLDAEAMQVYYETLKHGSLLSVFSTNFFEGLQGKLEFQVGLIGRAYQTLALFLIGVYIGRRRWPEMLTSLRRPLWGTLGAGCVLALATAGISMGVIGFRLDAAPWEMAISLAFYDLFNLALTVVIVSAFLLLYLRPLGERLLRGLVPVGKTALTCYVSQTIIVTFVLYGWGLGRLGELGAAAMVSLGAAVFGSQMIAASIWLRHFRFGPVEWVWRTVTYGRLQPMRLPASEPVPVAEGAPAL